MSCPSTSELLSLGMVLSAAILFSGLGEAQIKDGFCSAANTYIIDTHLSNNLLV